MKDSNFLLFKASAGSGKTFNLAIQYICLLLTQGENEFRRTLAVTFTNKATAEMKDRILEFLYNIWKGKGDKTLKATKETLKKQYGIEIPDEEIRERCHRALKAILHDYSRFCVSTIDAFFQGVLRSMAHELGLNARLQVDLNDKEVVELAVENLIDNLRHDNRDVLPYIKGYIEQQLADSRPWDVRRELKRMAKLLFKEEFLKRSLDERNRPFTIENIANFKSLLLDEKMKAIVPVQQEAQRFEDLLLHYGLEYEQFFNYHKFVRNYVKGLLAGDITVNFNKYLQDMASNSLKVLTAALRKEDSLHPIAQQFSQKLARLCDLQKVAAGRIGSIDLALANLTPIGLLGAIDQEITRLSNERSRFLLARTPIMLNRMIKGEDASFVFERIGTQFNNIMIDEFQDTSQLQWENFRVLLLDNLASGGLSMVVGDIKQSIYRWRNGDWRILQGLDKNGHNGIPLIQNPLRDNHRSQGRIVTFNNEFFPLAAAELDHLTSPTNSQLQDLYNDVEQGITKDKEEGRVRISICHSDDKEVQKAWPELMLADLCRQVSELRQQGVACKQMAILLRHKRHIAPIITYFAQHMPEVKLVSNEAFLLGASTAVRMIVNALQMVDDIDRNPVAVRYVTKHYLLDVCHRKDCNENDFLLPPYTDILPPEFTQHLDELRFTPLYELCEKIYRDLRIHEIQEQDTYLFTFFDELSTYLRDNPPDIASFLTYWEETMQGIAIPSSEVDGICVFTIHSSKGLAFHTVLMPYADWDIEKDFVTDLNWCSPNEAPLNEMGSLPICFSSKKIQGTVFEPDYIREHDNRRADELNALYVAFTRAKSNLMVWGLSLHKLEQGKYTENTADILLACLPKIKGLTAKEEDGDITLFETPSAPAMGDGFLPFPPANEEGEETGIGREEVRMHSYPGNLTFRPSSQASEFIQQTAGGDDLSEQQLTYIEQGKLLHYIFSKIETADDIDRVTDQFAKQGILKSEKQVEQVRSLARRGLRSEEVQEWFSGRYRLFNECNILVPDPDNEGKLIVRRPDRVMMGDDRIIVVDFKFGKPNPDYLTQVREYIAILQDMYPDRIVEGWLWYVYKNRTEVVL